jgi:hypothetical protein
LAIGFSKSGNGVLFLILRHANVLSAVAAWDSHAQLSDQNAFYALRLSPMRIVCGSPETKVCIPRICLRQRQPRRLCDRLLGGVLSDPASSSFVGVESPLSEGGRWNTPGASGSMAKNSGAYGPATHMAGLTTVVSADQFSQITLDPTPLGSSWVRVTTRIQGAKNGGCYLAIAYSGRVW